MYWFCFLCGINLLFSFFFSYSRRVFKLPVASPDMLANFEFWLSFWISLTRFLKQITWAVLWQAIKIVFYTIFIVFKQVLDSFRRLSEYFCCKSESNHSQYFFPESFQWHWWVSFLLSEHDILETNIESLKFERPPWVSLTLSEHYILETNLKFLVSEDLRWLKLIIYYIMYPWKRSMHLPVHSKVGGHKVQGQDSGQSCK